jgi:hypothetical protein
VNVEAKEQSNQWMYAHSLNKQKKPKLMLSACRKGYGSRFLGQKKSAAGGMQTAVDHNFRNVLRNTKKAM